MPTDNPAGLSERQYADIVAYLLAANRFRAGATELGGAAVQTVAGRTAEWHFFGGDAGGTEFSPLGQIDASNVNKLHVAWSWGARNFGPSAEFNWEVTPLMVGGRLFVTAGTRRDAVALDAKDRRDSVDRRNTRSRCSNPQSARVPFIRFLGCFSRTCPACHLVWPGEPSTSPFRSHGTK